MKLVQDSARLDDTRIDDIVVGVKAVAAHRHQFRVTKERQVLGDVCFGDAKLLYQ